MSKLINIFLLTIISALLYGCKFRPVYSTTRGAANDDVLQQLSAIEFISIESVGGAELYHHLVNLFPKPTSPKYLLKIDINIMNNPLVIQKDSDTVRQMMTQLVHYQLLDIYTNKQLYSETFRNMASYNVDTAAYASYVESESISDNLARQAAEEVRSRLILYFSNKQL